MHDIHSELNIVDRRVVEDPELLGKECLTCLRILAYKFFRRRADSRDGVSDRCVECEAAPRLSTAEHTARLREDNYNSEGTRRQRCEFQDDFRNDVARKGRPMHSNELVAKLKKLLPCLYFREGGVEGDIACFRVYGQPQPRLEGRTFEYLWYIPEGEMPEYSQYEFDEVRNIRVREKQRGWRTPLLRLIKAGYLTEEICDAVFGKASGHASVVWNRELWAHRNKMALSQAA